MCTKVLKEWKEINVMVNHLNCEWIHMYWRYLCQKCFASLVSRDALYQERICPQGTFEGRSFQVGASSAGKQIRNHISRPLVEWARSPPSVSIFLKVNDYTSNFWWLFFFSFFLLSVFAPSTVPHSLLYTSWKWRLKQISFQRAVPLLTMSNFYTKEHNSRNIWRSTPKN